MLNIATLFLLITLIFQTIPPLNLPFISNGGSSAVAQYHTLLVQHSEQCRPQININQNLIQAAEYRANHMAKNNYFDHNNPFNGETPNEVVTRFGFNIHESYSQVGNNGESIAAGYQTLQDAFDGMLESHGHRQHLLGLNSFYCQQWELGVGIALNPQSHFKRYYVVLLYRQH